MNNQPSSEIHCEVTRPNLQENGMPTRCYLDLMSDAERAIYDALCRVEELGASKALTDAVSKLQEARYRVADHLEGIE